MHFPFETVPGGPPLQTKKALFLIDFQNDFVSPHGKLQIENTATFIHKIPSLVEKFRENGHVVWVRTEFDKPQPTFSPDFGSYTILLKQFVQTQSFDFIEPDDDTDIGDNGSDQSIEPKISDPEAFLIRHSNPIEARCCLPDSFGCQYPDILTDCISKYEDLDLIKNGYSAFTSQTLLLQLRQRLITHIYICGSMSNVTVYATVLDAVRHGLEVTIVEDCLGYCDESAHFEAVRHMADNMGANGTDYQELMDDLAGLLGDVVHEEDFHTQYHVSVTASAHRPDASQASPRISDWVSNVDTHSTRSITPPSEFDGKFSNLVGIKNSNNHDSSRQSESARRNTRPSTPDLSPPRKRSTGDLDDLQENRYSKLLYNATGRRASHDGYQLDRIKSKVKSRTRKQKTISDPSPKATSTPLSPAQPASPVLQMSLPDVREASPRPKTEPMANIYTQEQASESGFGNRSKLRKKIDSRVLDHSNIGSGDSRLLLNVLLGEQANSAFYQLRKDVRWQKMYHRAGEVPRLVAVQGETANDNSSIPIYRHPADESPELLPFDAAVSVLRKVCEKLAGHPLNHVLIQWYRNSEDNISEHSDKTLDIVRGSSIVNLSLGAQRTMTLRTKKSALPPSDTTLVRPSQRVPLPHNSLFVLGESTNQNWLHSIRADKRLVSERSLDEMAFGGERISLTFRNIGTFLDVKGNTIWGQGATNKIKPSASAVLGGSEAEQVGETMIRAFGQENHRSIDWNWDEWYGKGFDVVNFVTKESG